MLMQDQPYQGNAPFLPSFNPPIPAAKKHGGRVSSPKYRASLEQAQDFEGLEDDVKRYDLLTLVKRAGKSAGFTKSMIALLEYYMGYTCDIDWQEGQSPIVYQALVNTARDLDLSERQIQNLEKQLFEIGAITWSDSGNYRRYGQRCKETGMILHACGIDLTPLAYLKPVLEAKLREKEELDKAWKETKRQISWYRGQIRGVIAELSEREALAASDFQAQYDQIAKPIRGHMSLETLHSHLTKHKELHSGVIQRLEELLSCEQLSGLSQKTSSKDEKNCAHKESTKNPKINKLITSRTSSNCLQGARSRISEDKTERPVREDREEKSIAQSTGIGNVTGKQLLHAASSNFKKYLFHPEDATLDELVTAAEALTGDLGISKASWLFACNNLTKYNAMICVLLTDQGLFREENKVRKPQAYFNGMVSRALRRELHLQKSVMGILKRENEAKYAA